MARGQEWKREERKREERKKIEKEKPTWYRREARVELFFKITDTDYSQSAAKTALEVVFKLPLSTVMDR